MFRGIPGDPAGVYGCGGAIQRGRGLHGYDGQLPPVRDTGGNGRADQGPYPGGTGLYCKYRGIHL